MNLRSTALLALLGAIHVGVTTATLLVDDPFAYTLNSTLVSQGTWGQSGMTPLAFITNNSLSAPSGLYPATGHRVQLAHSGVAYTNFAEITSGNIYASFLLHVAALGTATTGMVFNVGAGTTPVAGFTAYNGVWFRQHGTQQAIDIGIARQLSSGSAVKWHDNGGAGYSLGTTYFIVAGFEGCDGTSTTIANGFKLWINPSSNTFAASTPPASVLTGDFRSSATYMDNAQVGKVGWTASEYGETFIDEVRVGTTWADITPTGTINLTILTSASSVNVTEGSTATFQVKLSAAPPSDTTVSVARNSGDAGITVQSGASLTFTASNWDTYQTVTLAAAEDGDTTNGVAVIRCSSSGLPDKDVTATEIDNDTLAIVISNSTVNIAEGGSAALHVKLAAEPLNTTTVTVSRLSGDADISVGAESNLVFTISNWNVYQATTLAATEDADAVNGSATIRCAASGLSNVDATAAESDNDSWEIDVTGTNNVVIMEGGSTSFNVRVTAEPVGTATVTLSRVAGDADILVTTTNLCFTAATWSSYQPATLSAAHDADMSNGTATIRCALAGAANVDVPAAEQDDDLPTIVLSPTAITVPEGGTNGFQVKLSLQPPGAISISVSRHSGDADIYVLPGTVLNFTTSNWDTYQTAVVQSYTDEDGSNGVTTIRCSATGGIAPADVTATEVDTTDILISPDRKRYVNESGSNTFQVKLAENPGGTKVVTIARDSGDTDISVVAGASLTFDSGNWDTYQTVILAAQADSDDVYSEATIACSASGLNTQLVTAIEIDGPATFAVTPQVAQSSPGKFGVVMERPVLRTYNPSRYQNVENACVSFEPIDYWHQGTADSGGDNYLQQVWVQGANAGVGNWGAYTNNFWNGATIRIFRKSGNTMTLVREATVTAFYGNWGSEERIYFTGTGPAIQPGDIYMLSMTLPEIRWALLGEAQSVLPRVNNAAMSFGIDTNAFAPNGGSAASMKVVMPPAATGTKRFSQTMWQKNSDPQESITAISGATYRVSVWLKQTGFDGSKQMSVKLSYFAGADKTITLGSEWTNITHTFVAGNPSSTLASELQLETTSTGTYWIDNCIVSRVDTGDTELDWTSETVNELKQFAPQTIRFFNFFTEYKSVETWLSPSLRERGEATRPYDNYQSSLGQLLVLCKRVGARPWLILNPLMPPADHTAIMDYLAGGTNTRWGAQRIADGQTNAWLDEFDRIYLECGNETWNYMFQPRAWAGAPLTYSAVATYFCGQFQQHPNFDANKIKLIANGWGVSAGTWTRPVAASTPDADIIDVAYYIGGWDGVNIPGNNDADYFQEQLMYTPRIIEPYIAESMAALQDAGNGQQIAMYEGGPGYPVPNPGQPFDPESEYYSKSHALGVATLDFFINMAYNGFAEMEYFLYRAGHNWASHSDYLNRRDHASWLALKMYNQYCSGDFLALDRSHVRLVDLPARSGHKKTSDGSVIPTTVPAADDVPMVVGYTLQDGARFSYVFISREIALTNQVRIITPYTPSNRVEIYSLCAMPEAKNTYSNEVLIVTNIFSNFTSNYVFSLPPCSICVLVNHAAPTTFTPPLAPPSGLYAASVTTNSVKLCWTDNANNELHYLVERALYSDGEFSEISWLAANTTNYTDATVLDGEHYLYRVSAVNMAGSTSCAPIIVTTPISSSRAIEPLADARVYLGASAQNYGDQSTMLSGGTTENRSFLRFDVSAIPSTATITAAYLKVYHSLGTATQLDVREVADTAWGEYTITWANQPSASSVLASPSAATQYSWITANVTAAVTNRTLASFRLSNSGNSLTYFTKEAASNHPALVVYYSGSTPASPVLTITTTVLAGGMPGAPYFAALQATGGSGALAWSLDSGTLPTGVSMSSSGVISGTPTANGIWNFTVRVTDARGTTDTQSLSITISGAVHTNYVCRIVDYGADVGGGRYRGNSFTTLSGMEDVDGDGQTSDDFVSYEEYSETIPLNPPAAEYDTEASSAILYGGVAGFLADDGSLTEGMMNENHEGRDDYNLMADASGVHMNSRVYGAWLWKKEDFLNGGSNNVVSFDDNGFIAVHVSRFWEDLDDARWIIKQGNQWYISEKTFMAYLAEQGWTDPRHHSYVLRPTQTRWALYNPVGPYNIRFASELARYNSVVFTNVTAVGFHVYKDTLRLGGVQLKWYAFEADATITRPQKPSAHTEMTAIPAGTFSGVNVPSFYISATEVPYLLWKKIRKWSISNQTCRDLNKPRYILDRDGDIGSMTLSNGTHSADEPATTFTWLDAVAWCNAFSEYEGLEPCYYSDAALMTPLRESTMRNYPTNYSREFSVYVKTSANGYRLPTMAEWGRAAGSASSAEAYAWRKSNAAFTTHPVGALNTNEFGVFDMIGNVWEYVWDAGANSFVPSSGNDTHTVLGGSIHYPDSPSANSPMPHGEIPFNGGHCIGFRVARSITTNAPPIDLVSGSLPTWTLTQNQQISPAVAATPVVISNELRYVVGTNVYYTNGVPAETDNLAYLRHEDNAWVTVTPFYMSKNEITYRQWNSIYQWAVNRDTSNRYYFDYDGDMGSMDWQTELFAHGHDEPVTDIGWNDAILFCNALSEREGRTPVYYTDSACTQVVRRAVRFRLAMVRTKDDGRFGNQVFQEYYTRWDFDGYRLPTDAEWECAFRGGNTTNNLQWPWPGTDTNAVEYSWVSANSSGTTHAVGLKQTNVYGICDLAGNVGEWVYDWPEVNYYKRHNPKGAEENQYLFGITLRGGNFGYSPMPATETHQYGFNRDWQQCARSYYGFRVVRCDAGEHPVSNIFVPDIVLDIDSGAFGPYDPLTGKTFRNNLRRTGYYNVSGAPVCSNWSFLTGGKVVCSPIVVDGVVYVGSGDGHLYALDANAGTQRWRTALGGAVNSTPTVVSNIVYVGCNNGYLYAIYATNGAVQWQYKNANVAVNGAVAVAYRHVFAGWGHNQSDLVGFAIDGPYMGQERWRFRLGSPNGGPGGPSIYGTDIYQFGNDNMCWGIDLRTEYPAWQFVGTHCQACMVILDDNAVLYTYTDKLRKINRSTGASVWIRDLPNDSYETPYSSPAYGAATINGVATNIIVHAHPNFKVYGIYASTGNQIWEFSTGNKVNSSPALTDDGRVLVGSDDSYLYCLSVSNGVQQWRFKTDGPVWSSPCVTPNGTVYVGSDDGRVYCIANPNQQVVLASVSTLSVREASSNTFNVRLALPVSEDTTVTVSRVSGDTDLSVSVGANLIFAAETWSNYPAVVIAAQTDGDTNNGTALFRCAATGASVADVTVSEYEVNLAIVLSTNAVTVNEGATATFQIKLSEQPEATTTVTTARVAGDTDISVTSGGTRIFTTANWNTYQTVTLSAAQDADTTSDSATIRCSSPGLADKDVTATENDNDAVNISISTNAITVAENSSGTFGVRLSISPANATTVSVTRAAGDTDLSVVPSVTNLIFTSANWSTYQYALVAAADDADRVNGSATIQCVSPAVVQTQEVTATESDDDVIALVVTPPFVRVPEGGTTNFQVKLNVVPDYTITTTVTRISGDANISVSGGSTNLYFTIANYSTYQNVVLQASEDSDYVDGTALIQCSSPETTNASITAKERDNDTSSITFQHGVLPNAAYTNCMDADMVSSSPTFNYGAALNLRFINNRASLIKWPLTNIPNDAIIQSVTLVLNGYSQVRDTDLRVYACKRAWLEGTGNGAATDDGATWNTYDGVNAWESPGASGASDRGSTLLGSCFFVSGQLGDYTCELNDAGVACVQTWLTNPAANCGLLLSTPTNNYSDVRSRNTTGANSSLRPRLVITYHTNTASDVANLTSTLAGDYRSVALTWANNNVTILACTNRYYSSTAADWFVLAQNASMPFVHAGASNYASIYYRIISGVHTSSYDVGKYDVPITAGPSATYIGSPFVLQAPTTISNLLMNQLSGGALPDRDAVSTAAGTTKYIQPGWTGAIWSNALGHGSGLLVYRSAAHSNATHVTFAGMVATNTVVVPDIARSAGNINYLSTLSSTTQSLYQCGLTNGVLVPGGTVQEWDTLYFCDRLVKYKNNGTFSTDRTLAPGESFLLQYKMTRTPSVTNWYRLRP
jgi:formylglycine-generating enzyme required for sulfatase activity/outer membrane protein assembly factor BamB